MAINTNLKCLMLTALFLLGLSSVQAQTANYYLDPNSETPRFIQRLSWSGGTYSLHCEVIIEKEEGGEYVNYMNKITTGYYLDISMPPGNYRFRVVPYDILGKPTAGTQWEPFKVFNAIRPELYQPGEDLDYFNDRQGSQFEFNGKNIEPDAQIYFVNSKGERIVPAEVIKNNDGSGFRVVFDKGQLNDGEYEVFVVNPGGLDTSVGGIEYKTYREKFGLFHFIVGASIMPAFHIYGEGSGGFPCYFSAKASMISCIYLDNYLGLELSLSRLSVFGNNDYIYGAMNGFTFGYNFLFINWLNGREAAVNLKFGVGFSMQPMDLSYTNIGVSFMYRVYDRFYIEAGVDFPYSFYESASGYLLPFVGISVVF